MTVTVKLLVSHNAVWDKKTFEIFLFATLSVHSFYCGAICSLQHCHVLPATSNADVIHYLTHFEHNIFSVSLYRRSWRESKPVSRDSRYGRHARAW